MAAGLAALVPQSLVVGEEAAEDQPEVLAYLSRNDPVWVIDPVDGTANFAAGNPDFAVMVGLVVAGETQAGWIHNPISNTTAVAVIGEGAWMGTERLCVAQSVPLAEMTGSLGPRLRRNKAFSGQFAGVTYTRCCGIDYLAMVQGNRHFAFYRRFETMGPCRRAAAPSRGGRLQCLSRRDVIRSGFTSVGRAAPGTRSRELGADSRGHPGCTRQFSVSRIAANLGGLYDAGKALMDGSARDGRKG